MERCNQTRCMYIACSDSPLVHVVLGVVQPHAHLHGVTLPDEVEDVLHGEAAVVPCIPLYPPVSPVTPAPGVSQSLLGCCAQVCCCPACPATSPKLDSLDCALLAFPRPAAAHVTCVAAGASPASCTLLATATWSENRHNMSTGPQQGRVTGAAV